MSRMRRRLMSVYTILAMRVWSDGSGGKMIDSSGSPIMFI